ncbi:PiggyBac transposable element-derived protein 4 [Dictyocoela muelleri]|nr:PiggyBac transposable element-derived protein 4 [Dictyocoela muelleri]
MDNKRKRITYLCEGDFDENGESNASIFSEDSEIIVNKNTEWQVILSSSESEDSNSLALNFSTADEITNNWQWQVRDNIPKIWNFTEVVGIKSANLIRLGKNVSSLDVFYEIFNNDFWEMLANETNRYANQTLSGDKSKLKIIDKDWSDTTSDEIQIYFALCITMTQVKKSAVHMNWSKIKIIETPIYGKTMPYKRFKLITRFLHFTNNDDAEKSNKLKKVDSIVKYFNDIFKKIYSPEEMLSLDESLMKFKGRLSYIQFNPSKRARFGIKFYKICESKSGYCSGFKIYTGNDKNIDPSVSASESIVMKMVKPFLGKGYTLFLDNWYSSPQLYFNLLKKKINVIGTVRPNRKNMPKTLVLDKLKRGEVATQSTSGLLALKWKDKKDVYLLSTKHKNSEIIDTGKMRWDKKKKEVHKIIKPACVIEYNFGMGGVDRQDQVTACFPIMKKFMKGYKKMFFYMMDIALFNSYVIYCKLSATTKTKMHFVDFRLDIAERLLKILTIPNYKIRGRQSQGDTPLRLQAKQWAHFPQHISPTKKKKHPTRECKVCRKHNKRSETTWECKQCLVALHVPECFEKYHTLNDY